MRSEVSIAITPMLAFLTWNPHTVLVHGTVYVDDEPYWKNLLAPNNTYDVVYREPIFLHKLPT